MTGRETRSQIGCYRGVKWIRHRICDVMTSDSQARWYFIYGENGKPTGDHFRTVTDMQQHIDDILPDDGEIKVMGGTIREAPAI